MTPASPDDYGFFDQVAAWLSARPRRAVVPWYSDDLDRRDPVGEGWVDVLCTPLQDDVGCNWVWTIVHELTAHDAPDQLTIVAAPDRSIAGEDDIVPGWSAGAVTRALHDWIAARCGRADLRVMWDPDGPKASATRDLEAMLAAHRAGIEPTYLLHPGDAEGGEGFTITASEQVMEFLLDDFLADDDASGGGPDD